MKFTLVSLTLLLVLLQIRLWTGDGSVAQVRSLRQDANNQQERIEKLKVRNQTLEAEVQDLKLRMGALEERARTDLGMIRQGETFYQFSANGE